MASSRTPTRVLSTILATLLASVLLVVVAAPAGALPDDPGQAEQDFYGRLNHTRAENGLGSLARDVRADEVARRWSAVMDQQDHLHHNPNLVEDVERYVTTDWYRLGENVGYGWSVESLHQAFWDSPGHRQNMLGDFNRVGVGVVVSDRIWVTFVFMKAAGATASAQAACSSSGYVMDAYGGLHSVGSAPGLSSKGYWPGWNIARDLALTPDGTKGFKLDGFGGLHPVGNAKRITGAYWHGWDIARGVAVTNDGNGAYVLDAWGGIHAAGNAPSRQPSGYWPGWTIARDIVVDPTTGTRGYVLDGFGGLHPFGGMPKAHLSKYFGKDIAASVVMLPDGSGGYVVNKGGAAWAFAVGNKPMPAQLGRTSALSARAVGLVLGDNPTVVATNGSEVGAANVGCGRFARWSASVGKAVVSR